MNRPLKQLRAYGLRLALLSLALCATLLSLNISHAAASGPQAFAAPAYLSSGGHDGNPTPSPTASPTPTPSPRPSASPTPTPTPTATPSPTPTPGATPTPTPAPGVETRVEIDLVGAALNGAQPRGEAELKRRADGSREFEVKVRNVNLAPGTRFNVLVDGAKVGELVLTSLLDGKFELDTRDGQTLPPVVNGTTVSVTNQAGATIVAGAFNVTLPPPGATPTPTPTPNPTPSPTPTPQHGAETRLRIALVGAAVNGVIPKGHADARVRADGRKSFEVEVEDVNLPAGTLFTVLVDNVNVGQIVLGQFFKGELELEAEHGQSVPAINNGTTVAVINSAGATLVVGSFGAPGSASVQVNPLEDASFFVRQQYIDFLNRAPDEAGFNAWVGVLNRCAENGYGTTHPECDRVLISSGFYRSQEFLGRGFFIYRAYEAALGRLPHYNEFLPELGRIGRAQSEAELEVEKSNYLDDVMHRSEFSGRYAGLTDAAHAEDFISRLEQTASVRLANHAQLVDDMRRGVRSAAQTLRAFLDSREVNDRFVNRGFVTMQYFGYLRRDPEAAGWNAWVDIITNGRGEIQPGDYRPLIFGFVHSQEYRNRFGQP